MMTLKEAVAQIRPDQYVYDSRSARFTWHRPENGCLLVMDNLLDECRVVKELENDDEPVYGIHTIESGHMYSGHS